MGTPAQYIKDKHMLESYIHSKTCYVLGILILPVRTEYTVRETNSDWAQMNGNLSAHRIEDWFQERPNSGLKQREEETDFSVG